MGFEICWELRAFKMFLNSIEHPIYHNRLGCLPILGLGMWLWKITSKVIVYPYLHLPFRRYPYHIIVDTDDAIHSVNRLVTLQSSV